MSEQERNGVELEQQLAAHVSSCQVLQHKARHELWIVPQRDDQPTWAASATCSPLQNLHAAANLSLLWSTSVRPPPCAGVTACPLPQLTHSQLAWKSVSVCSTTSSQLANTLRLVAILLQRGERGGCALTNEHGSMLRPSSSMLQTVHAGGHCSGATNRLYSRT